jgi:RNA polymerase sigma-70 factor (ECF subfamily)
MQIDCRLPDASTKDVGTALAQPPDGALIVAIAAGDTCAMRVLYVRHNVGLYRFIVRLTRDRSMAEDLVSEVFLDVWRNAGGFEHRSKVSTWLLGIARHKIGSAFRHRADSHLDERFAATIEDPADDPERALDKQDRRAVFRRCLAGLSPAHREIIDLVYYHDQSVEDVSEVLGIPPPAPSRPACTTHALGWRNCSRKPGIDLAWASPRGARAERRDTSSRRRPPPPSPSLVRAALN